jgi:importin subunit beta-1
MNLPRIMTVLLESSKDVPNVAEKVCGAIYFLAQGYEDAEPVSSLLTPYLPNVIAALLTAADRGDMAHFRLRSSYEALNKIVSQQHT